MNLFKVLAKVGIDTTEFDKGIKGSAEKGKKFSTDVSEGIFKGLGTLAKGVAKVGTIAGTGLSILGGIGVKYNSDMESYTTNFKVMLGSQEKAIKKVEELKKMAAKTPFGMEELASATQVLLSFGMASNEVTPTLKMIGDVSLGNKEKFKALSLAFAQVQSAGKLMGQDLLQMVNQGFNPLQIISEMTGESMSDLKDEMANGAISAEMVAEAFEYATSKQGKFYNGMNEASKTTAGLMSTLKDDALAKTGELFGEISEKLKELIPKAIEFIAAINVKEVVKKMEELFKTFVNLLPVILGVTSALFVFATGLKIINSIVELKKALSLLSVAQLKLNLAMSLNPIVLITSLIAGLITAIVVLWNTNEDFRNALINAWEEIKNAFQIAFDFIVVIFNGLIEWFKKIPENFRLFVDNVINYFNELPYNIGLTIGEIIGTIVKFGIDLINWAITEVPKFIGTVVNFWWTLPVKIWEVIVSVISNVFQMFANLINMAVTEIPKFFNAIVNKIRELPNEFLNVGRNLVNGLVNGVKEKIEWAKNVVKNLFSGITQGVMNIFEQRSPSKLFAKIGLNNDKGFIKGILEGENEINRAIDKVYGGIDGGIGLDINSTSRGIKGMISDKPTFINLTTVTNLDGEILSKSTEKTKAKKNLQYQFS